MDMIDLSKLRIYLDNKAAENIVSLALHINEETLPRADVMLIQRFPTKGLFQSGIKEVITQCALENWRDQVLRLRTVKEDGSVSEEEGTEEVLLKEEEDDENNAEEDNDQCEGPVDDKDDILF